MILSEPTPLSWHGVFPVKVLAPAVQRAGILGEVPYRCASLEVESPHRRPIVHRVECSDLVDSHGWHLQYPCHFVHDTDTRETMLPLPKVQEWHHGGFLILWRVAFEDLIDKLLAYGGEFERNLRIVVRGISVLRTGRSDSNLPRPELPRRQRMNYRPRREPRFVRGLRM